MEVTYKNGNFMWLLIYRISYTNNYILNIKSYAIYMVNILPVLNYCQAYTPPHIYNPPFLLFFHSTFSVDCIQELLCYVYGLESVCPVPAGI